MLKKKPNKNKRKVVNEAAYEQRGSLGLVCLGQSKQEDQSPRALGTRP